MVWAALPPVPTPTTGAAGDELVQARDGAGGDGDVARMGHRDPGPEPDARGGERHAVSVTQSSRQTRWVSVIHTVS